MQDRGGQPAGAHRHGVATTRWSVVLQAGGPRTPASQEALAKLAELYWHPLYAYIRRCGHDANAAQDLVQAFFLHLLEKQSLRHAQPERGRFRSFLLASLKHLLLNQADRERAQKRGGRRTPLSLDMSLRP